MYLEHFGFREYPFQLTPNTAYFYGRAGHREALEVVQYSLDAGDGFLRITGEVGTGKSLLCRLIMHELRGEWRTALIPNPALDPESLRYAVAWELGIDTGPRDNAHMLLARLDRHLRRSRRSGRRVVLIIDEAQVMPDESLEMIRLLTNLETEREKLLQVVLVGQPELDTRLAQPHLRQLRERCVVRHVVQPIPDDAVPDYLTHRLLTAGYRGSTLFSDAAVRTLVQAGHGVPRTLNTLSHKSLISAYSDRALQVDKAHVLEAIDDTESVSRPGLNLLGWFGAGPRVRGGAP